MQEIEIYYKKIDRMLKSSPKKKGNGLLSPSSMPRKQSKKNDNDQLQIVADIVAGIREAREEMMNGK